MSIATPTSCLPCNLPRSGSSLRRTGSFISLTDLQGANSPLLTSPYVDSVNRYMDTQEKRFRLSYETAPRRATHSPPPTPVKRAAREREVPVHHSSSPLAPAPQSPPPRPSFPRSKGEPDLYKVAITTRMRSSPEGQQILQMGSHLAVQIMNATRELEGIVAAQRDVDGDVVMADAHLSSSWLVVSSEDWEMVDC